METPDFLEVDLRTASFVDRWGIGRMLGPRSLTDHSFFVIVYAWQVADLIEWKGSYLKLLMWAIAHDMDEIATGDVMGFFKRAAVDTDRARAFSVEQVEERFGSFIGDVLLDSYEDKIDPEIRTIVKVADLLDDACRLRTEEQLGNNSLYQVFTNNIMPTLEAAWLALPGDKGWLKILFETKVKPRVDAHYLEPVRSFPNVAPAANSDGRPGRSSGGSKGKEGVQLVSRAGAG